MRTFKKSAIPDSMEEWTKTSIKEKVGTSEEHTDDFWRFGNFGIEQDKDGSFECYAIICGEPFKIKDGLASFEDCVAYFKEQSKAKEIVVSGGAVTETPVEQTPDMTKDGKVEQDGDIVVLPKEESTPEVEGTGMPRISITVEVSKADIGTPHPDEVNEDHYVGDVVGNVHDMGNVVDVDEIFTSLEKAMAVEPIHDCPLEALVNGYRYTPPRASITELMSMRKAGKSPKVVNINASSDEEFYDMLSNPGLYFGDGPEGDELGRYVQVYEDKVAELMRGGKGRKPMSQEEAEAEAYKTIRYWNGWKRTSRTPVLNNYDIKVRQPTTLENGRKAGYKTDYIKPGGSTPRANLNSAYSKKKELIRFAVMRARREALEDKINRGELLTNAQRAERNVLLDRQSQRELTPQEVARLNRLNGMALEPHERGEMRALNNEYRMKHTSLLHWLGKADPVWSKYDFVWNYDRSEMDRLYEVLDKLRRGEDIPDRDLRPLMDAAIEMMGDSVSTDEYQDAVKDTAHLTKQTKGGRIESKADADDIEFDEVVSGYMTGPNGEPRLYAARQHYGSDDDVQTLVNYAAMRPMLDAFYEWSGSPKRSLATSGHETTAPMEVGMGYYDEMGRTFMEYYPEVYAKMAGVASNILQREATPAEVVLMDMSYSSDPELRINELLSMAGAIPLLEQRSARDRYQDLNRMMLSRNLAARNMPDFSERDAMLEKYDKDPYNLKVGLRYGNYGGVSLDTVSALHHLLDLQEKGRLDIGGDALAHLSDEVAPGKEKSPREMEREYRQSKLDQIASLTESLESNDRRYIPGTEEWKKFEGKSRYYDMYPQPTMDWRDPGQRAILHRINQLNQQFRNWYDKVVREKDEAGEYRYVPRPITDKQQDWLSKYESRGGMSLDTEAGVLDYSDFSIDPESAGDYGIKLDSNGSYYIDGIGGNPAYLSPMVVRNDGRLELGPEHRAPIETISKLVSQAVASYPNIRKDPEALRMVEEGFLSQPQYADHRAAYELGKRLGLVDYSQRPSWGDYIGNIRGGTVNDMSRISRYNLARLLGDKVYSKRFREYSDGESARNVGNFNHGQMRVKEGVLTDMFSNAKVPEGKGPAIETRINRPEVSTTMRQQVSPEVQAQRDAAKEQLELDNQDLTEYQRMTPSEKRAFKEEAESKEAHATNNIARTQAIERAREWMDSLPAGDFKDAVQYLTVMSGGDDKDLARVHALVRELDSDKGVNALFGRMFDRSKGNSYDLIRQTRALKDRYDTTSRLFSNITSRLGFGKLQMGDDVLRDFIGTYIDDRTSQKEMVDWFKKEGRYAPTADITVPAVDTDWLASAENQLAEREKRDRIDKLALEQIAQEEDLADNIASMEGRLANLEKIREVALSNRKVYSRHPEDKRQMGNLGVEGTSTPWTDELIELAGPKYAHLAGEKAYMLSETGARIRPKNFISDEDYMYTMSELDREIAATKENIRQMLGKRDSSRVSPEAMEAAKKRQAEQKARALRVRQALGAEVSKLMDKRNRAIQNSSIEDKDAITEALDVQLEHATLVNGAVAYPGGPARLLRDQIREVEKQDHAARIASQKRATAATIESHRTAAEDAYRNPNAYNNRVQFLSNRAHGIQGHDPKDIDALNVFFDHTNRLGRRQSYLADAFQQASDEIYANLERFYGYPAQSKEANVFWRRAMPQVVWEKLTTNPEVPREYVHGLVNDLSRYNLADRYGDPEKVLEGMLSRVLPYMDQSSVRSTIGTGVAPEMRGAGYQAILNRMPMGEAGAFGTPELTPNEQRVLALIDAGDTDFIGETPDETSRNIHDILANKRNVLSEAYHDDGSSNVIRGALQGSLSSLRDKDAVAPLVAAGVGRSDKEALIEYFRANALYNSQNENERDEYRAKFDNLNSMDPATIDARLNLYSLAGKIKDSKDPMEIESLKGEFAKVSGLSPKKVDSELAKYTDSDSDPEDVRNEKTQARSDLKRLKRIRTGHNLYASMQDPTKPYGKDPKYLDAVKDWHSRAGYNLKVDGADAFWDKKDVNDDSEESDDGDIPYLSHREQVMAERPVVEEPKEEVIEEKEDPGENPATKSSQEPNNRISIVALMEKNRSVGKRTKVEMKPVTGSPHLNANTVPLRDTWRVNDMRGHGTKPSMPSQIPGHVMRQHKD